MVLLAIIAPEHKDIKHKSMNGSYDPSSYLSSGIEIANLSGWNISCSCTHSGESEQTTTGVSAGNSANAFS
jgi:hypothetical protein